MHVLDEKECWPSRVLLHQRVECGQAVAYLRQIYYKEQIYWELEVGSPLRGEISKEFLCGPFISIEF